MQKLKKKIKKKMETPIKKTDYEETHDHTLEDSTTTGRAIHTEIVTMAILPELSYKQMLILDKIAINSMDNFPNTYKDLVKEMKGVVSHQTITEFIEVLKNNNLITRVYRNNFGVGDKENSLADKRYYFFMLNLKGFNERKNQMLATRMKKQLFGGQKTL